VSGVRAALHRGSKVIEEFISFRTFSESGELEERLVSLVQAHSSFRTGCPSAIRRHSRRAEELGIPVETLRKVSNWRQSAPTFCDKERAALEWSEAVTLDDGVVSDSAYARARAHFSEEELLQLTVLILTTHAWNRLSIAFRHEATGTDRS
jgi:alkylhydroperoxidase family enzyme